MFLGDLIKEFRNTKELSQRDFAKLCGLSHTYIAALEKIIDIRTGKPIAPTLESVKLISSAMGKNIQELLDVLDGEQPFLISNNITESQVLPLLGVVKARI
jgi:transcriptional regulator with XRE-family HTH domain